MRVMNEAGVEVDMETFSTWRSHFTGIAMSCILGVIAYAVFILNRPACLLVGVLAFVAFEMEIWTWPVTSRFQPRSSSSNVIGRIHPEGDALSRVVVTANYDTGKTSPFGGPRSVKLFRPYFIVVFLSMLMLAALGFVGVIADLAKINRTGLTIIWYCFAPFAFLALLFAVILLWGEIFGTYSRGANDNASGVAVMLSVVEAIAAKPLEHIELWAVATSRGYAGGRGMVALMKRHHRQIKDSMIINIDHAGVGDLRVIRTEGPVLGFRASRRLTRAAFKAAKKMDFEVTKGRCRVKMSDAMVALARRRPAVTIGCLKGGAYPGWRNKKDRYDDIDREALDHAVEFVTQMLRVLDT
jgi:Peptidase family M28